MSPLGIEIALWYYARATDYRDGDFTAPAVREMIDSFRHVEKLLANDVSETVGTRPARAYCLTERGRAYVDALMNMPLPVCRWEILQQPAV